MPGQCTEYKLKFNQYKRSSGYQLAASDIAISDNFLSDGWYRFKSGAGNDMITRAPSLTMCGTVFPVWLNGMFILLTLVFIYIRDDYSIDWCMYKKYNMIFFKNDAYA